MYETGIGCIGSRRITVEQEAWAYQYGRLMAVLGHTVKSGGAVGADLAFMKGARDAGGRVICYLPWYSYNADSRPEGCELVVYDEKEHEDWVRVAEKYHPAYKFLKRGAKLLMSRNTPIILGSHWVVAIPAPDRKGGTEQGIRIANGEGISLTLAG